MTNMKTTDRAYLAGIVDADGTIGIKRNTYAMRVRGDATQPNFEERVCVRQVEPHAVDALKAAFGGYRYVSAPSAKNGRPLEGWEVRNRQAVACLRSLLPFLRIKRKQAENCLALRVLKECSKKAKVARGRGHVGAAPRDPALTAQMEALTATAHSLNRVGV